MHHHGSTTEADGVLDRRLDVRPGRLRAQDRVLDPRGERGAVYFFFSL
jgi:hypothetical protein